MGEQVENQQVADLEEITLHSKPNDPMEYVATCRVVQPQNTWWVCPRRSQAKCCPSQGRGSGS